METITQKNTIETIIKSCSWILISLLYLLAVFMTFFSVVFACAMTLLFYFLFSGRITSLIGNKDSFFQQYSVVLTGFLNIILLFFIILSTSITETLFSSPLALIIFYLWPIVILMSNVICFIVYLKGYKNLKYSLQVLALSVFFFIVSVVFLPHARFFD